MLDGTRPKAVAESRLHSSSVKVHGAPSPRWNPWQRGRREHPRAGNPRSLLIRRPQVKSGRRPVLPQFESGGRRASCRAFTATGIASRTASAAKKTRTNPTPYRTERTSVPGPASTGARTQSTKPPARICHRRLNTQGIPESSHGFARLPGQSDDLLDLPDVIAHATRPSRPNCGRSPRGAPRGGTPGHPTGAALHSRGSI